MQTKVAHGGFRLAPVLGLALMLGACASPPKPIAELEAARQAIVAAEQAQAAEHASAELSQARTKLASAENAAREEEMTKARRLADEARVEAQLATARTAAAKAIAANDEIRRGTEVLIDELQRNTGGQR